MPIKNPITTLAALRDVDLTGVADGDMIYYDSASGTWKPVAHKDAKTGVHGVGARYVAETTVEDLDLAAHKTRHQDGGNDEISLAALSGDPADTINKSLLTAQGDIITRDATVPKRLAKGALNYFLRMGASEPEWVRGYEWGPDMIKWQWELAFFDWTTTLTGSGAIVAKDYGRIRLSTGNTANSTARGRGFRFGWIGWGGQMLEWYIKAVLFNYTSTGKLWYKFMDADTAADPTNRCVGWRVDGNALKGIIHNGTTLIVVDLAIALTNNTLFLKLVPGDKVYWYVDGVLKGSSADIPTGDRTEDVYLNMAMNNGATASRIEAEVMGHGWIAKSTG